MATGDSEEGLNMDSVGLLVCTPEKFDALTRVRESAIAIMSMLRLLMIDKVHSVGDSRGAAIEIVVSRTKLLNPAARLVAVSASVGNPHDFCQWLSNAQLIRVDDSNRSVPLHRHVLGFPSVGMNPFQFENSLNSQLSWIIRKHSSNLPTLIFCSTRRSAESTADYLSKSADYIPKSADYLSKSADYLTTTSNNSPNSPAEAFFTTPKLNTLTSRGVAFHNAGIPFEDRRTVEYMFINGKIKVLCATSTLAVGVNLPAHLVIIKGTKQYTNRGYEEYDVMDIQQMIGRAGRPQFDQFGVAVILTTQEKKDHYQETSVSATIESRYSNEKDEIISSRFSDRLTDALVVEVGVGTINNLVSAKRWLESTFFGTRILQCCPTGGSPYQHIQSRAECAIDILDLLEAGVRRLVRVGILEEDGLSWRLARKTDRLFRFCLSSHSMAALLETPAMATHEALLKHICMAFDPEDYRLQSRDKGLLNRIAAMPAIRFKLKGKITEHWQKAYIAIQLVLSKNDEIKTTFAFSQDSKLIMTKARRLIRCLAEVLVNMKATVSLRNVLELEGAIHGETWHEGTGPLRQIPGIGPSYAASLVKVGLGNVLQVCAAEPSAIEVAVHRNPPFGHQIVEACRDIPRLTLNSEYTVVNGHLRLSVEAKSTTNLKRHVFHLLIILKNQEYSVLVHKVTFGSSLLKENVLVNGFIDENEVTVSWICSTYGISA